jgi:integral membrane protein
MVQFFRIMGRLEGFSFLLLLLVAMPLKYYAGMPLAVRFVGSIHGGLFLAYCASAFWIASSEEWPAKKHLLAYAAAVFPCGTFWFEKKYLGASQKVA